MISSMPRKISDQNDSRKRATIANVQASTPITKSPIVQHSISLSRIDTASSSSGGRKNLQLQMQDLVNKHTRRTKKRKTEDTNDSASECEPKQERLIDDKPLNKKRKRKKKTEKKTVRGRQILRDTDSEWETESEKSINKFSTNSQGSIVDNGKLIKLFDNEDPYNTPEKTRDMPSAYEEILHMRGSPIIGSFTKTSYPISKKNDIILPDALLPVNLQLTEERNLEESDENETTIHCESNARTRVPEKSPKQNSENFEFPKRYSPTATNSLHRNQFVKTYSRKISRHLASSPSTPIKLMDCMRKLPNVYRKRESSPIPLGMLCKIESCSRIPSCSRNLKQWLIYRKNFSQNKLKNNKRKTETTKRNMKKFIRKQKYDAHDAYDQIDKIDIEFETGGQDGKRISFREFCLRQKKAKDMSIIED